MESNLWIANGLSAVTACFTIASAWTKHPQRTYTYQVAQCLVYAVAAYFFGVYSCIVMMLINALRNYLVSKQKFTGRLCVVFCAAAICLGLLFNQRGIIGLLSVFATVEYTVLSTLLKEAKAVKINVLTNLMVWFTYDCLFTDIFSGIVDGASILLAALTLIRMLKEEKKKKEPHL